MNKCDIRNSILSKRKNIDDSYKKNADEKIYNTFISSEIYSNLSEIFIYISTSDEVNTKEIIKQALKDGKKVFVPKINNKLKEMKAINIKSLENLAENRFGILEPTDEDDFNVGSKFQCIVVPGVAFDKEGSRIGYGGGYYDKYLYKYKGNTPLVALAYDVQIVNKIYEEIHDIKMDYVMSEKEFIKI